MYKKHVLKERRKLEGPVGGTGFPAKAALPDFPKNGARYLRQNKISLQKKKYLIQPIRNFLARLPSTRKPIPL